MGRRKAEGGKEDLSIETTFIFPCCASSLLDKLGPLLELGPLPSPHRSLANLRACLIANSTYADVFSRSGSV
jgi:hypothetical protein